MVELINALVGWFSSLWTTLSSNILVLFSFFLGLIGFLVWALRPSDGGKK